MTEDATGDTRHARPTVRPAGRRPSAGGVVLAGAGAGAAALALSACGGSDGGGSSATGSASASDSAAKGSATAPLSAPASLTEAPMLADQVKAGTLPKLEERLPEKPYVIPHNWLERGQVRRHDEADQVAGSSGDQAAPIAEYFYGYSILRLLNDGNTIGPGLAEKWEANADASEWTFHFRKGLKWSDGEPWSTADIMFWWNDMANNDDYISEVGSRRVQVGKGHTAKIEAVDDLTLKVVVRRTDAAVPAKIASYVNGYKGNGAVWMVAGALRQELPPEVQQDRQGRLGDVGGEFGSQLRLQAPAQVPDHGRIPADHAAGGQVAAVGAQPVLLRGQQGRRPAALRRQAPDVGRVGPQDQQGAGQQRPGRLRATARSSAWPCADVQTLQGLAEKNNYPGAAVGHRDRHGVDDVRQPGLQGGPTTASCSTSRSSGRR